MIPFRFALPLPPTQVHQVNDKGQLEGPVTAIIQEIFIYFVTKYNLTWVTPETDVKRTDEYQIAGVDLITQDKVDGSLCTTSILDGLPRNVTTGPIVCDAWCKIATSPTVSSTVISGGPEIALKQLNPNFLVLIFLSLFFMLHMGRVVMKHNKVSFAVWMIYVCLVRQNMSSIFRKSFVTGYLVLVLSLLFIQILFGSLLHTERTTIDSFERIDSFEEVEKHNLTTLVLDVSSCPKLVGEDREYEIIPVVEQYLSDNDLSRCLGSGCPILINTLDHNILTTALCSVYPDRTLKHFFYLSPPLGTTLGGFFLSDRIPKPEQDRINSYIQRSFEMGLEIKKGPTSKGLAMKSVKTVTQLTLNEECFSKEFQTRFSNPVPLSYEFYRYCFMLYLLTIFVALAIHFSSLIKNPAHDQNGPDFRK